MGRRSQKSRAGQAKERTRRALKDSESPDGNADEPSVDEEAGSDENGDTEGDTSLNNEPSDALDGELADGIATGYASFEADQNPQTRCSNCKTIFEVSPELLSSSDTRVRCGECLSIFDALDNLRLLNDEAGDDVESESADDVPENPGVQPTADNNRETSDSPDNSAASLDVTYADFSLFSADAALPEIEYLDETREIPAFDFDDPGGDDELDETYSETLFAHGPEVDARSAINETDAGDNEMAASGSIEDQHGDTVTAGQQTTEAALASHDATLPGPDTNDAFDELLDSLQQPEPRIIRDEEPSVGSWWLRSALFLLLLSLAAGLYGYRERAALQHNRYLRPALQSLCATIGCTLAEQVDLAALQVLKRSVFSHPKLDNVLVITIGFVNKASFSQRYPVLEIRLTDRNGDLVVKNSFEPSDYLENWQADDVLETGKRLDISLNVEDPGHAAMSFELDFR